MKSTWELGQAAVPREFEPPTWQQLCARQGRPEAGRCPHCGAELQVHSVFGRGRSPPAPYDELARGGTAA